MPVIKIRPRDILETRATETLRQIARYDLADLTGEFGRERFSLHAELHAIRKEVERLEIDWEVFYTFVVQDVEAYESGRRGRRERRKRW